MWRLPTTPSAAKAVLAGRGSVAGLQQAAVSFPPLPVACRPPSLAPGGSGGGAGGRLRQCSSSRTEALIQGRYAFSVADAMPAAANGVPTPSKIYFATGNNKKLQEVVAILAAGQQLPFEVEAVKLDLPELQGEPEDIAREKARLAAQEVGGAVMVEDTCLCFVALKGLPGPYIKWFLEKLGHDGLNRMLDGFDDRSAWAQCTFAYTPGPGYEPVVFVGKTDGRIVPARGPLEFGWDPVFEITEYAQTYAEMDKQLKNTISHRYRALDALRTYLLEQAAPTSAT